MTTQKEIDEMFIGILENISEICDKTTTGNVSHNIATIKCKFKLINLNIRILAITSINILTLMSNFIIIIILLY